MTDRPRLLLTRRWPDAVEVELKTRYDVAVDVADQPLSEQALRRALGEYDVLCPTVSDRIDAFVLSGAAPRVRLIANYGAGVDNIDLVAARAAGIQVTNTPDVLTDSTAELAVLLMLMVARRAGEGEREVREARWAGWSPTHLLGQQLAGKTLGLVGFGRIGQATAAKAMAATGMQVLYHSRKPVTAATEALTGARYIASLADLAARADVLSIHCHGGAETRHLVDRALLTRMKPTAILINTARGSIVDEAAVAEALAAGRLWGVGFDVFEREPAVSSALRAAPNVVMLPHLGSAVLETRVAMGMRVAANIDRFFAGQELLDRVA